MFLFEPIFLHPRRVLLTKTHRKRIPATSGQSDIVRQSRESPQSPQTASGHPGIEASSRLLLYPTAESLRYPLIIQCWELRPILRRVPDQLPLESPSVYTADSLSRFPWSRRRKTAHRLISFAQDFRCRHIRVKDVGRRLSTGRACSRRTRGSNRYTCEGADVMGA